MELRRPWRRGPDRLGPARARLRLRGPGRGEPQDLEPPAAGEPFGADSVLGRILTMRAIGLPCPEPLAVIRAGGVGWTARGATPDDAAGWARELAGLPRCFTVRPAERPFGTRLAAFTREGRVVRDQYGNVWALPELAELLLAPSADVEWMVEARAPDHPMLACVLDVGPMPAVVAVTLLGPGELPVLLSADLAVEPHGGPVGRRRHGPARELLAVDVASGRMVGGGPDAVLPAWGAAQALIARAARAAPDHRAMGWDVLLTARGPMLAAAWSPWWGPAGVRARRVVEWALRDRTLGQPPLGEPLDP